VNDASAGAAGYFLGDITTENVSWPSASKPGSTAVSRTRLCSASPAPMSSTTDSATSEMTSATRKRWRALPALALRPPARNASAGSAAAPWIAGASPKTSAVTSESATVARSTRPSSAVSARRGMSAGPKSTSADEPQLASASAPAAPIA
jgi:hypothetical protein